MSKEIKNIVSDEIFNAYESIRNFLLGDQKRLEELAKIEGREEIKDAISGATTSVAKCLLDVLSFGLASSLLEATSGVVESIKGNSNETERLLSAYDKIAKQYNKQNKAEIKKGDKIKLQTTDEMLDDIYKDSGMTRRQFKLLKNSMTRNFMSISLMKHKQKVDMLEGKLLGFEGRLQALEKQIQQQKVEETHTQNLSDKFKGLERLELPKTNDIKGEQIQTPLASQPSDDKVSKTSTKQLRELDDENSRVKSARKEIEERTHQNGLASRSMPC